MKFYLKNIYILLHITNIKKYLRSFNKKIFIFRTKNTPLCSFYNKEEETPLHIFSECTSVLYLWQRFATFSENDLILPALMPQAVLLGLWSDNANQDEPIINHVLLIFKLHVYNSREKHRLNIINLLTDIKEIKKTEYRLSSNNEKRKIYQNKWHLTHEKLPI